MDGSGVCRAPIFWLPPEPAQVGSDHSPHLEVAFVKAAEGLHPKLGARCHITASPCHSGHCLMPWLATELLSP